MPTPPAPGSDNSKARHAAIERDKIEAELKEALLWQKAAIKAGNIGFWDWDLTSNRVHYSAEWKKQIGYAPHEISDDFSEWEKRVHPEDLEPALAKVRRSIDQKSAAHKVEFRFRHKNGDYIWILAQASIIQDEKGRPIRMLGSHVDITHQKKIEKAIQESESRYRQLFENILDGFALHELICRDDGTPVDYRFLSVNPAFETLTGLKKKEILGKTVLEILPKLEDYWIENYGRVVKTGQPVKFENYSKALDRYFQVTAFKSDANQFVSIFQDITKRKQYEHQLKKTSRRLSAAQRIAKIGDWEWDPETDVVTWSENLYRLFGLDPDQPPPNYEGQLALYHPQDAKRLNDAVVRCVNQGQPYELELKRTNPDGRPMDFLVKGVPKTDDKGKIIRLYGSIQDVTDYKKMEATLHQTRKMEAIGTLAGGIAHEFNNMLGIILGNTELALDDLPEDSPTEESINEIKTAALRARDVVKSLLRFSRKNPMSKRPVNICSLVRETVSLLRRTTPTTVEINTVLHCSTETIMADEGEIIQVMMNLFSNALHALGDAAGFIDVRLDPVHNKEDEKEASPDPARPNWARLTITDSGMGIEPQVLDHVFEPYFTTKEIDRGIGMGLSVVHGIVKNHGGDISIRSTPGQGTEVDIFLPLIVPSETTDAPPAGPADACQGTGMILIVDDEPAVLKMTRLMLERCGYRVESETSGKKALSIFMEAPGRFDLVITDMAMPEITGDRLARELFSIRPDIPVILCTGHSDHIDEGLARKIGIKGFLRKPYSKKNLQDIVGQLLAGTDHSLPPREDL